MPQKLEQKCYCSLTCLICILSTGNNYIVYRLYVLIIYYCIYLLGMCQIKYSI